MRLLGQHNLTLGIIFSLLLSGAPKGIAHTPGEALQVPQLQYLVGVIAALNVAMEKASRNPMNREDQKNVKDVFNLMPAAIMGVAQVFERGEISDKYGPMVLAMMGGFVDQNAPTKYKEFMKNPKKELIPKTGAGFPSNVKPISVPSSGTASSAIASSAGSKSNPVQSSGTATSTQASNSSATVAATGLPSDILPSVSGSMAGKSAPVAKGNTFYYDQSKSLSNSKQDLVASSKGAAASNESSAPVRAAGSSASSSSAVTGTVSSVVLPTQSGPASVLDENAIDKMEIGKEEKEEIKVLPKQKKDLKKSKIYQGAFLHLLIETSWKQFVPEASAEAPAAPAAPAGGAPQKCGDDAGGGCGSASGGGSGGGGQQTGQILMALALAASSIVPAIVQAEAQKDIAKTEAKADKEIAQIKSAKDKYLSDNERDTKLEIADKGLEGTLDNNATTLTIAEKKNEKELALESSRSALTQKAQDAQYQLEYTKLDETKKLNDQKLALDEKVLNQQITLAAQQRDLELVKAGLTGGYGTGSSSSNLSVTKTGQGGAVASNTSAGSSVGSMLSGSSSAGTTGLGARGAKASASETQAVAVSKSAGDRLLSMLRKDALGVDDSDDESGRGAKLKPRKIRRKLAALPKNPRAKLALMRARGAVGSNQETLENQLALKSDIRKVDTSNTIWRGARKGSESSSHGSISE